MQFANGLGDHDDAVGKARVIGLHLGHHLAAQRDPVAFVARRPHKIARTGHQPRPGAVEIVSLAGQRVNIDIDHPCGIDMRQTLQGFANRRIVHRAIPPRCGAAIATSPRFAQSAGNAATRIGSPIRVQWNAWATGVTETLVRCPNLGQVSGRRSRQSASMSGRADGPAPHGPDASIRERGQP
jgi:hypothetical protein